MPNTFGLNSMPNNHDRNTDLGTLWRADWGIKQWIPFLLGNRIKKFIYLIFSVQSFMKDLLLDGDSITTEMVMHYLLGLF
jgi:hypothetical protein